MKRILITAMESSSGKTVLTCGLLWAFRARGIAVESFKRGPDYIDPMFHRRVLGIPGRNLDRFLMGPAGVHRALESRTADLAVVEGAMGFFDGLAGTDEASAWQIAAEENIPAILAVRPKGSSLTLAAQIRGLQSFRKPDRIAGVFLMECRKGFRERLSAIIERETGLPVVGWLPPMEEADLPSRHLGLVTADEVEDFARRFEAVGNMLEKTADLDRILRIAAEAEREGAGAERAGTVIEGQPAQQAAEEWTVHTEGEKPSVQPASEARCRIAVARDEAFCFYYEDSLRRLEECGAELVFFSPMRDRKLPKADGLYLGGGYPELYAEALDRNLSMRESVRAAVLGGMPTVAECGGFLFLQRSIRLKDGAEHPMAGALPGESYPTKGLVRFGYIRLRAEKDSLLFRKGEKIPAHEFHHWDTTDNGSDLTAEKPSGQTWKCGFASPTLYAAFPHLHLAGELPLAERFAEAAAAYKRSRR